MTKHNTALADINEILFAYYVNREKWYCQDAKQKYEQRLSEVTAEEAREQDEKAKAMAKEFFNYTNKSVKNVYWTSRPNTISTILGIRVDQRKNPTDILIEFTDGTFLGVSAKSTKGKGDIGFKNPGLGTIEKDLNLDLSSYISKTTEEVINKFNLNKIASIRKQEIRERPDVQEYTQNVGSEILKYIRDKVFDKLSKLNQSERIDYISNNWLEINCKEPSYIKITGMGTNGKYSAKIEVPERSQKTEYIRTQDIGFEQIGNDSIGVFTFLDNSKNTCYNRIMKIRFKYESEKMASSIKASGDPWTEKIKE